MELVLRADNDEQVSMILAFAKKSNITVENIEFTRKEKIDKEALKQRILNFKAKSSSSFGDAALWEREQRQDRKLPFSH